MRALDSFLKTLGKFDYGLGIIPAVAAPRASLSEDGTISLTEMIFVMRRMRTLQAAYCSPRATTEADVSSGTTTQSESVLFEDAFPANLLGNNYVDRILRPLVLQGLILSYRRIRSDEFSVECNPSFRVPRFPEMIQALLTSFDADRDLSVKHIDAPVSDQIVDWQNKLARLADRMSLSAKWVKYLLVFDMVERARESLLEEGAAQGLLDQMSLYRNGVNVPLVGTMRFKGALVGHSAVYLLSHFTCVEDSDLRAVALNLAGVLDTVLRTDARLWGLLNEAHDLYLGAGEVPSHTCYVRRFFGRPKGNNFSGEVCALFIFTFDREALLDQSLQYVKGFREFVDESLAWESWGSRGDYLVIPLEPPPRPPQGLREG